MNSATQPIVNLNTAGIRAIAEAMLCVASASDHKAGPDAVDTARLKFETHIQEARDAFGQWFAELLASHPVTPEQDKPVLKRTETDLT